MYRNMPQVLSMAIGKPRTAAYLAPEVPAEHWLQWRHESLALTLMILLPASVACLACTKIRVSASSWLHGTTLARLIVWLLTVSSSLVTMTTFGVAIHAILSARKLNSTVLLSLSLGKFRQFEEILPSLVTLRLTSRLCINLVSTLRFDDLWTLNTMSVLLYLEEYACFFERTLSTAYFQTSLNFVGANCSPTPNNQW